MNGEISNNGVTYLWSLFGGIVTVTAPDARQKKTQLGGSPAISIAKLLAAELGSEKTKNDF